MRRKFFTQTPITSQLKNFEIKAGSGFGGVLKVLRFDGPVKSREAPFFVIPAEAGIQSFQMVTAGLDSGFHRSEDFLRDRQILILEIFNIFLFTPLNALPI